MQHLDGLIFLGCLFGIFCLAQWIADKTGYTAWQEKRNARFEAERLRRIRYVWGLSDEL